MKVLIRVLVWVSSGGGQLTETYRVGSMGKKRLVSLLLARALYFRFALDLPKLYSCSGPDLRKEGKQKLNPRR